MCPSLLNSPIMLFTSVVSGGDDDDDGDDDGQAYDMGHRLDM